MKAVVKDSGKPLPKSLANKPVLSLYEQVLWQAYCEVCTERQGSKYIPWSSIYDYGVKILQIDPESFEFYSFHYVVRSLEKEELEFREKEEKLRKQHEEYKLKNTKRK